MHPASCATISAPQLVTSAVLASRSDAGRASPGLPLQFGTWDQRLMSFGDPLGEPPVV